MNKIFILSSFLLLISCFAKKEQTANQDNKAVFLKELKIPKGEQLKKIFPQPYNFTLAAEKGICNNKEICLNYLYLQALYRKGLDQYLLNELNLKKYDDILANSNLRFIKRNNENQNLYQQTSSLSLSYIYLHNNIYIEKLDRNTLYFLQGRINNHNLDVDEKLIQVVKETYPDVIKVFLDNKEPTKGLYSVDGRKIAWNNAVIFEIGHQSEFDEKGNYVSRENEMLKDNYLKEELIPQMEKEFSEKLDCPVTIFIER
ncbi:hypothetical protein [Flavobacterium sp. SH_e]|uniref:hypothetical protein n=1 Tax=Flavobacterium sp. SH_e TaxID=2983767 RepID=UPI0021E380AA|nr:hypothetical protein [Flavobacterium sp. SH_e]